MLLTEKQLEALTKLGKLEIVGPGGANENNQAQEAKVMAYKIRVQAMKRLESKAPKRPWKARKAASALETSRIFKGKGRRF